MKATSSLVMVLISAISLNAQTIVVDCPGKDVEIKIGKADTKDIRTLDQKDLEDAVRKANEEAGLGLAEQEIKDEAAAIKTGDEEAATLEGISSVKLTRGQDKVTITINGGAAALVGRAVEASVINHELGHRKKFATVVTFVTEIFTVVEETTQLRDGVKENVVRFALELPIKNVNAKYDDLTRNGTQGGEQTAIAVSLAQFAGLVFVEVFKRKLKALPAKPGDRDVRKIQDIGNEAKKVADAGLADVNLNNLEEQLKQLRKDFDKELEKLIKKAEKK